MSVRFRLWLNHFAGRIDELIHRLKGMARLREMVRWWEAELRAREDVREEFERRRRAHEDVLRGRGRLRDKKAGPPKPDWVWEYYPEIVHFRKLCWCYSEYSEPMEQLVRRDLDTSVCGWTPPHLSRERWPEVQWPLPVPPDRVLRLKEAYAVLAAVRDHALPVVEAIDPWRAEREAWNAEAFTQTPEMPPGQLYVSLVDDVQGITEDDRNQLQALLREVEADLELRAATPTIQGYRSADTLGIEHGIRPERLSKAAGDGKVRTMLAPKGTKNSEGRDVRVLYCKADAMKHCSPKRLAKKSRRKRGSDNS